MLWIGPTKDRAIGEEFAVCGGDQNGGSGGGFGAEAAEC